MFVPSIQIMSPVIDDTTRLLRRAGRREAVVYWAGLELAERWLITTTVCPRHRSDRGSFVITAGDNARVVQELSAHRLAILGQVHSHPGEFIDHSEGDDEWASFAFVGFISIVVPSYARRGLMPLADCGVHRYEDRFRRLSAKEVTRLFSIVPSSVDHHDPAFLIRR